MKRLNLVGQKFNQLTVLSFVELNTRHESMFSCLCDCGNVKEISGANLKSQETKSCGCLKGGPPRGPKEIKSEQQLYPSEYHSYTGAKGRCNNINNAKYFDYGGRGIEFRFNSFSEFLKEVRPKPTPEHTLDRKNNDGHYEIGNVRWSTPLEQGKNKRKRSADGISADILVAYAKSVMGEYYPKGAYGN